MPILTDSAYEPPFFLRNGHVATIFAGAIQQTNPPKYRREKWEMPDGDFLLVDGKEPVSNKAVVLCHGLEGDSTSGYNNLAASYFLRQDYAVFAWNNRSCGGAMNRLPRLYHHASVDDLDFVVQKIVKRGYAQVYLLGFSLGGAQILNYFGRRSVPSEVKAGVAVSTPIWLQSSARCIEKGLGKIYAHRFIRKIKTKALEKAEQFPDLLNRNQLEKVTTFEDLAKAFIVPVHGFTNIRDYYHRASPGFSQDEIKTPVLILNALNDPMLGAEDYPEGLAKEKANVFLETPRYGGHCAFPLKTSKFSYPALRAERFFKQKKGL